MANDLSISEVEDIRDRLSNWHRHNGRRLPWREDRKDPYRVVVSEMMLVQTTVAAVIPYYRNFFARFPTIESLAAAHESEVLKQWEGLGYYRRARQLHAFARAVVDTHGGAIPNDEKALLSLPGVGRYIAGAVRSFAFDRPAPILEANTIRLLSRLIGMREIVTAPTAQKRLWNVAAMLVPPVEPGTFNQALMDLGASVCMPRKPDCPVCPLRNHCAAYREGIIDQIPAQAPRKSPTPGEELAVLIENRRDESVLIMKRPEQGLWSSFWEPPTFWSSGADPARRTSAGLSISESDDLPDTIRGLFDLELRTVDFVESAPINYAVTRYRMTMRVVWGTIEVPAGIVVKCPAGWTEAKFVPKAELDRLTLSSANRRAWKRVSAEMLANAGNPTLPKSQ